MNYKLFTSESVCAGHPDKICDQISDAILDEALRQDPQAKTAIETIVKDRIIVAGEIKTTARIDYENVVRTQVMRLGYTNPAWGFSADSPLEVCINEQSAEIAQGVGDDTGAGDQGMMFGYACRETPQLMPMPISLAHAATFMIDHLRESKKLPWLRPDGKAQVTVRYEKNQPVAIETFVLAVAHDETIALSDVADELYKQLVKNVVEPFGLSLARDQLIVNGTGAWHIPGPANDAGLTGRKIIVDSYGGYARVGGGAFSGKDPSKVDRSGAYAARYIAKNIVSAGLCDRAEVALAYAIGTAQPVMQAIETFGTAQTSIEEIETFAHRILDTSVHGVITGLSLRKPLYLATASYGHFGRDTFPWEKTKPL